jgi:hypothetical protein
MAEADRLKYPVLLAHVVSLGLVVHVRDLVQVVDGIASPLESRGGHDRHLGLVSHHAVQWVRDHRGEKVESFRTFYHPVENDHHVYQHDLGHGNHHLAEEISAGRDEVVDRLYQNRAVQSHEYHHHQPDEALEYRLDHEPKKVYVVEGQCLSLGDPGHVVETRKDPPETVSLSVHARASLGLWEVDANRGMKAFGNDRLQVGEMESLYRHRAQYLSDHAQAAVR